MDPKNRNDSNIGRAPAFAVASAVELPTQFEQAISDVPSSQQTTVVAPSIQMTHYSKTVQIRRNEIIAQYYLNPPFVDGLVSVSKIYKVLEKIAFNYQREHQGAFFEDNPQLMIQKPSEVESLTYDSTAKIRLDYKKFAKRLAHYYYHFGEIKKMQLGAMLNIMLLSRLTGTESISRIASACRWSKINTNMMYYSRTPAPNGLEQYMTDASKYAVGETSFGGVITAFPLWITDIYGNRAFHNIPIDNLITSSDTGNGVTLNFGQSDDSTQAGAEIIANLIKNITVAIGEYGADLISNETNPAGVDVPGMPDVLNIGVRRMHSEDTNNFEATFKLNFDRKNMSPESNGAEGNLLGRLWNNYFFWDRIIRFGFSDMADPNNGKYIYAVEYLKLFSKASSHEDIYKAVRSLPNVDMVSLAKTMEYKSGSKPNTATIIKYAPPLYQMTDVEHGFMTESNFEGNFERYEVDNSNTAMMIQKAKEWPHINPTMFCQPGNLSPTTKNRWYVVNSAPSVGTELNKSSDFGGTMKTPTGKFATLLDYAVSASVDPLTSRIQSFGMSKDFVNTYFQNKNSIVYEESPDSVWVMSQPLIDNTDLCQCGFNLMLSFDEPVKNEWVKHFTEPENYPSTQDYFKNSASNRKYTFIMGAANGPAQGTRMSHHTVETKDCYGREHTVNPDYLDRVKHAFIFLGGSIFDHPWLRWCKLNAGYYGSFFNVQNFAALDKFTKPVLRAVASESDDPQALWLINSLNKCMTKDDTDSNHMAALHDEFLNTLMNETTGWILDCYFSEAFGPVAPIAEQSPLSNTIPMAVRDRGAGLIKVKPTEGMGCSKAIVPSLPYYEKSNGSKAPEGSTISIHTAFEDRSILHETYFSPATWLIPFLDSVRIPVVKVSAFNTDVSSESTSAEYVFASLAKWAFTVMSRCITQFSGLHETVPFWTNPMQNPERVVLETTSQFPENNILQLPRVNQTARKPQNTTNNLTMTPKPQLRSESQYATASFGGAGAGTDDQKPNRGGRRDRGPSRSRSHSRRGGKRGGYKGNGTLDPKGNEVLVNSDSATNDVLFKNTEGSQVDYSSKAEDTKFAKGKKALPDSLATQQG